ncbi:phosphatase [Actinoplanes cyaneus]|uniref:Phosphatase n=1 Tax=Actinoplanes cyaneus TaxID=52696 RepID=A0A919M3A5_9ACTN|nr:HAD family phosphatase [Actinoplanes cyaneus]MCW2135645.1 haloacid dehalogenase superfamily, subfamily IA, variant 3 with third motif having DD or ED [Actinoplanes cyaneus]GID62993.1 phosphatase [Actinoplanes cyaneus]
MLLPLPPGDFQAYLFDCDGTITDSMPVHYQAWQEALAEWGADFPEDLFYAWGGRPAADIIVDLNARQGLAMPVATVNEHRESLFQSRLATVQAVPGVLQHLQDAYGRVPFAVVSGSTRDSVTASLTALGLLDRFPVLVCAEDYANPKPDPEPYLTAARLLGADPATCVVFEDTELGVQAAKAAGMAYVKVPPPWERAGAG